MSGHCKKCGHDSCMCGETPTPRTDAAKRLVNGVDCVVDAEVSEKLERELYAAMELDNTMQWHLEGHPTFPGYGGQMVPPCYICEKYPSDGISRLSAENAQLRKELEGAKAPYSIIHNRAVLAPDYHVDPTLLEKAHEVGMEMKRQGIIDIGPISDRDSVTKEIAHHIEQRHKAESERDQWKVVADGLAECLTEASNRIEDWFKHCNEVIFFKRALEAYNKLKENTDAKGDQ